MPVETYPRGRPIRWFFLAWAGFVYLWGLLAMWGLNAKTLSLLTQCQGFGLPQNPCTPRGFLALLSINPITTLAVTALMALFVALLWRGLSGDVPRRALWPYVALQGALVSAIFLVGHQQTVAFSLYLALTLAAISLFRRAGVVIAVAAGCIVLFLLTDAASGTLPSEIDWRTYLLATDYPAVLLFIVGYLVLYAQQAQEQAHRDAAHAALAAAHVQLEGAHAQLVASAARIEELTVAAERQRLARDLHDTLAQGLAGVIMQLQAANARLSSGRHEQAREAVQQAMACARSALADARGAIDDLRATTLPEQDVAAVVRDHISRVASATGLICQCELAALASLPTALADQAARAIMEGVTNVARHARATRVWVSVVREGPTVAVEIRDEGCGFDPATIAAAPHHYGLLGMRERARAVDGELTIDSAPGAGTAQRLRLPCPATPACDTPDATTKGCVDAAITTANASHASATASSVDTIDGRPG